MKISLTPKQIDRGAESLVKKFEAADKNKSGFVTRAEVDAFSGKGKSALKNAYEYARHLQGAKSDGKKVTGETGKNAVSIRTAQQAVGKLANALKDAAKTGGDHDGKLEGNAKELGEASKAGKSLALYAHRIKGGHSVPHSKD